MDMLELLVIIRDAVMAVLMAWAGLTDFDTTSSESPSQEFEMNVIFQTVSDADCKTRHENDLLRSQSNTVLQHS